MAAVRWLRKRRQLLCEKRPSGHSQASLSALGHPWSPSTQRPGAGCPQGTRRRLPKPPFAERGTLNSPGKAFLGQKLSTLFSDFLCEGLVLRVLILFFFFNFILSSIYFYLRIYFWPRHITCRILVPHLGIEPCPLHWEWEVTGLPGKSWRF